MEDNHKKDLDRRSFLKMLGAGAAVSTAALYSCGKKEEKVSQESAIKGEIPKDKMTMRTCPSTGDRVSILGYGMMRLPTIRKDGENGEDIIDQEMVNRQVDMAMEHGVNYYDTSPAYCKGRSERATGIALSRHPREKFFVATKLSNFALSTWSREASLKMYHNSFKELQVDYIDYLLLHSVGSGGRDENGQPLSGMDVLRRRYFDNGLLDFLLQEREAGRVRNLGFSYHGDIAVFDYLLSIHDKVKWDFVQIQLNYVDWAHAKEVNASNTNAEYLYAELQKRNIPAIIMEPLLGGRLAKLPDAAAARLKQLRPDNSIASWAFRYAGTFPGVLTVLSGMTYTEHLQDNLRTYCPLDPCTEEENGLLNEIARVFVENPFVPCTACQYCMPCPYGINIPAIFTHYNKCINEGYYMRPATDPLYAEARRAFLVGYDRSVPKLRQADHCIGCGKCVSHCPQKIRIPHELHRISRYVEKLKLGE